MSADPATESWQRHAWDEAHARCVECGQPWPCDIAKAINYGIDFGRMAERFSPGRSHDEPSDAYLEVVDRILPRLRLTLARALSEEGL